MKFEKFMRGAKEILIDPGFGFSVCCTLLFSATSPVGLAGCLTATAMVVGMKTLQIANPALMRQDNAFTRAVKDGRTPLRILGLALLLVMGATLSQNVVDLWSQASSMGEFVAKGMTSTILPALASTSFAIGNFGYAAITNRRSAALGATDTAAKPSLLKLAVRRPETYNAFGMVTLGFLAGGLSLVSLPFVISGFVLSMRNIIQKREGHESHPNMHFAGGMAALSVVSLVVAQPVMAVAYALDAFYLGRVEALSTPGGAARVKQDLRESFRALKERVLGRRTAPAAVTVLAPEVITPPPLPDADQLTKGFAQARQPAAGNAVDIKTGAPAPGDKPGL